MRNDSHHDADHDGNKTEIYAWNIWRVRNRHKPCGIRGGDDHRVMFGMSILLSFVGLM